MEFRLPYRSSVKQLSPKLKLPSSIHPPEVSLSHRKPSSYHTLSQPHNSTSTTHTEQSRTKKQQPTTNDNDNVLRTPPPPLQRLRPSRHIPKLHMPRPTPDRASPTRPPPVPATSRVDNGDDGIAQRCATQRRRR